MRLDSVPEEARTPSAPISLSGTARFAPSGLLATTERELRTRRFLWVSAPASPPPRGHLRIVIDEAVELALAMRGALPARVEPDAALETVIADQVFRTVALGAAGLAVALPCLSGGARSDLDPSDSAALLAWLTAARSAPITLLFQEPDRQVQVLAPLPLAELIDRAAAPEPRDPISREQVRGLLQREQERSAEPAAPRRPLPGGPSMAAAELVADDPGEAVSVAVHVDVEVHEHGAADAGSDATSAREAPRVASAPAAVRADGRPRGVLLPRSSSWTAKTDPLAGMRALPKADPATAGKLKRSDLPGTSSEPGGEAAPAAAARGAAVAGAEEPELLPPTRREVRKAPPARVLSAAEWRALAVELDNARGPKPVRVIEQLFATHYVPLLGATLSGEADAAVRGVVDAWRTAFEHSYRESFSALRVTGKRPPMVFDAPDMAARIGRLNGARAVKLLLVDAMRFDLGERVAARLKEATANRAVLVERPLLWAALPTTTSAQLALLGRGPEGLRDAAPASEPEPAIARGRAVATLRRERAGARELMKLDLVEARLRSAGPPFAERIEAIADEVAEVVGRFIEGLPARTLLLVFGDHGFRMTPLGDGTATGPATQGGCSPEEVLVPAQAWLVGGVH